MLPEPVFIFYVTYARLISYLLNPPRFGSAPLDCRVADRVP